MSPKILYIFISFLLHIAMIKSLLQVERLQVVDADHRLSGGSPGYSRNFSGRDLSLVHKKRLHYLHTHRSSTYALTYQGIPETHPQLRAITTTAYFCSEQERISIQIHPWYRLRAAPGSLICPYYRTSALQGSPISGFVQWYGTTVHRSPDDRSVAEIVTMNGGSNVQVLGKFSYEAIVGNDCLHTFSIPLNTQPGSLYTVYGIWNVTGSLLVHTSCFDIEIIGSVSDSPGLLGPSQGPTTDVTAPDQKGLSSSLAVSQQATTSLSGQQSRLNSRINTQRASAYTGSSSRSRATQIDSITTESALSGTDTYRNIILSSTVAAAVSKKGSGSATIFPSLSTSLWTSMSSSFPSSEVTIVPHLSSIESKNPAESATAGSIYMTIMGGSPSASASTSGTTSICTGGFDKSRISGSATSYYSMSKAIATSATISTRQTSTTSFMNTSSFTSSATGTASIETGTTSSGNIGWGDTIKSSYSTETYCPSTDFCSRSTLINSSVRSACVELVANGCTDAVVGSDIFFGLLKFTANQQLDSCKDSAPLTVEGCEIGLMHAANYINSRLEEKGTLPCTGTVKLANKNGKVAGTVKLSGTCIPEYTG